MKRLMTDADFENAILFQTKVEVYFAGELDARGVIEEYSEVAVKVMGNLYMRSNCEFRPKYK